MRHASLRNDAQFRIRDATSDDSKAVRKIVYAVLREFNLEPDPTGTDNDLEDVEDSYRNHGGIFRVVESCDDGIVGCGGLYRLDANAVELRKMYFLRSARGQGLGKRLLCDLLEEARRQGDSRVVLETASVLKGAIELYRSNGFRPIRRTRLASRCDQAWELILS
jgi:putative acetyltransferase